MKTQGIEVTEYEPRRAQRPAQSATRALIADMERDAYDRGFEEGRDGAIIGIGFGALSGAVMTAAAFIAWRHFFQ